MFDRETTHHALERVTNDVVRHFSGLPVQPADDLIPLPSEECVCGREHFGGSVSGIITVAAPVGLCRQMAGDASQADGASSDAMLCASQTIAELVSSITSGVIAALLPEQSFTVSMPITERSSYHDWVVMSCSGGTVRLSVAGHPLLAMLSLRPM